jgi:hypothetical protein
MPKRKEAEPLAKVTLNLYRRDWEKLQELYPVIGASKALRSILRQHVTKVEAKVARATEDLVPEIDLPEESLADV